MNIKAKTTIIFMIATTLLFLPSVASQESTSLEIIGFSGGVGGVTVDIENTGNVAAEEVWVITTVSGGFLGNIDITHECTGCSSCGSSLAPGSIKTENSREAAFLLGFGPIEITTSAGATNADEISDVASGFALGPIVIIN